MTTDTIWVWDSDIIPYQELLGNYDYGRAAAGN